MLIQIFLILGFCLALWITWKRYGQQVVSFWEALAWSFLWLAGTLVVLVPTISERLAAVFGVGRGVDFVLYAAVAIQFFLIFRLFIQHERLERILTELVQQDALRALSQSSSQAMPRSQIYGSNDSES